MGVDLLDITFRIEKKFELTRFRPQPSVAYASWTAGDLFEQVWRGLHGEEPAWVIDQQWWDTLNEGRNLRRASQAYLATFHQGWQIFRPEDLNRLIPASRRQDAWTELAKIFDVTMPPLERPEGHDDVEFPLARQTCQKLIDLFERKWAERRLPHFNEWRPAQHPPPENANQWTRDAAWQALAEILRDCLVADLEEITPEATLVGDLGME